MRSVSFKGAMMSKAVLDADEILQHASPVVHQTGHEIQPYGHLIRMPIALAESACKESVDNLNQSARGYDDAARFV
jgi:starvation-inducible DNA-binding protein